jgi:hypothetical protein
MKSMELELRELEEKTTKSRGEHELDTGLTHTSIIPTHNLGGAQNHMPSLLRIWQS